MYYRFVRATFFILVFAIVVNGAEKEGTSLKDDHKALQALEGLWTRSTGKGKTQLLFTSKDFPKLEMTITELVRSGKGFEPKDPFKVNAVLQEKDGKRILVIEGKAVAYSFKEGRDFLILKGEIEYKKKKYNLTGEFGSTQTK